VYSSSNGGASWTSLFVGDHKGFISSISLNPSDPSSFIIGSYNQRSFAKAGGGGFSTISQPGSDAHRFPINDVLTIPALNLQVAASAEGMMTRPISYGANPAWVRRLGGTTDVFFTSVVVHPQNAAKLVAGTYGGGLYVSNDGGMNWAKVSTTMRSQQVQTLAALDGS